MEMQSLTAKRMFLKLVSCALITAGLCVSAWAQQSDYESERRRAAQLLDESKIQQALPIFEKLAQQKPDDAEVQFWLGFCIVAKAAENQDLAQRRQERIRARGYFLHAKQLGMVDALLEQMLASIPPDGTELPKFSKSPEAEAAMNQGEAAYTRGELEQAFAAYSRALALDPTLYYAALFAGDMQFKRGHNSTDPAERTKFFESSGEWFAKAIKIDADKETAYRYWGDCLLEYGKTDEAKAKFIEAIIADPYNGLVYSGIGNWARKTQTPVGHPRIESPNSTSTQGDKTTLNVDPRTLNSTDGTNNWLLYDLTRMAWQKGDFFKNYPEEKTYRHSLKEEAAALRMVAEACAKDVKSGKVKALEQSLDSLVQLNNLGLLEAYILFAHPDKGIARDYADYRAANRDRLKRYWLEVAIVRQ